MSLTFNVLRIYGDVDNKNITVITKEQKECLHIYLPITSNVRDSMVFHCLFKDFSREVKNLIWLKYFRLAYFMLDEGGFARVYGNEDCIMRTIT